jgi:hypothetical protein
MATRIASNAARLLPSSSATKHVLVVDENPLDLRDCLEALAEEGYEVASSCCSYS